MAQTEDFLRMKSKEEKLSIQRMINNQEVEVKDLTIESLLNGISVSKVILNDNVNYAINLPKEEEKKNLYDSIIQGMNQKIDKLIDLYNSSNTFNRVKFQGNKIQFHKITQLRRVKLEVENLNYDVPITHALKTYSYDGEIKIFHVIPFNYDGLYGEYLELKKENTTTFNVNNKTNIYFYSCTYTNKGFQLGNELHLIFDEDYYYDEEGKLVINHEKVKHKELFIRYQPGENVFDVKINQKVHAIEVIVFNDKMNIDEKMKKSLVIYE